MDQAIAVARAGIAAGQSPFGAVVATPTGQVIVAAHNTVRLDGTPTAHAEVNAIQQACQQLGTIALTGHLIATTCEPCPMCAAAIHWADLDTVIYGASIADADTAGFRELHLPAAELYAQAGSGVQVVGDIRRAECAALFAEWQAGPRPQPY